MSNPNNPKGPNEIKYIKMTVMGDLSGIGIGYGVEKVLMSKIKFTQMVIEGMLD